MFRKQSLLVSRYDWYAMGNYIIISVFAKLSDPEQTFVEANRTSVSGHFVRNSSYSRITLSRCAVESELL